MFKQAIKKNSSYIKPIITGYKTPYNDEILGGMGTVMCINKDGWVLTCKHIAENIIVADKITTIYKDIKKELIENKVPPKKIYKKYGIEEDSALILKNVFLNLVDKWEGMRIYMHDYLDLALIKFENPGEIFCDKFPVFSKDNPEQGEFICRLGFPYPEISCFKYNHITKEIDIKKDFDSNFQPFPMLGMVTRVLIDDKKKLSLFEMTNASLKGQSGGPIFNKDGVVVGMQIGNASKDLFLDIDTTIKRDNKDIKINQYSFKDFGVGINVTALKEFMDEQGVKYSVEK